MKIPKTAIGLNRRRNDILRRLDVGEFMELIEAAYGPQKLEAPDVPLAAMHKCRVNSSDFSNDERELSRQWLKEHDYREEID